MQLQWLNQVATVKTDGTVQLEVPLDIKPQNLDFESEFPSIGPTDEDPGMADIRDLPPLQIVMLIVGTRGDVQPFVAIGKRFQVMANYDFVFIFSLWKLTGLLFQ